MLNSPKSNKLINQSQRVQDRPDAATPKMPPKKQSKVSIDIDLSFVRDRTNVSKLHVATLNGDVQKIKQLIQNNGANPDCIDSEKETPLFYALRANELPAFVTLISLGSDPYLENAFGLAIPCLSLYLKFNGMLDKHFYHTMKDAFGLDNNKKTAVSSPMMTVMESAKKMAISSGKKLLIILGELHDSLPIYQVKKIIFKMASQLNIAVGYAERPDHINMYGPLRKKMHEKYSYTFYPVDIARMDDSITPRALRYREAAMTKEIERINEPGILVTGCIHLQGFFNRFKKSDQYHILPINLSGLEIYEFDKSHERLMFAENPEYFLQVDSDGLQGDIKATAKRWCM